MTDGSPTDPNIDSVWRWFEFQLALIKESRAHVLRSEELRSGAVAATLLPHEEKFKGYSREEVEEFFDAQRRRLELLTMLELLATTEAILRLEVYSRITLRRKDSLSRRLRRLHKVRGNRIRLDEDILATLKDEGISASAISAFRGALKLRHWLAHGRYWRPKLGRDFIPHDVFDISRAFIDSIPR